MDLQMEISSAIFLYYLKHEQQCFIRYKDTTGSRVSLFYRFDKTRTANVLNCFKKIDLVSSLSR
jgi:hypothetical protein